MSQQFTTLNSCFPVKYDLIRHSYREVIYTVNLFILTDLKQVNICLYCIIDIFYYIH